MSGYPRKNPSGRRPSTGSHGRSGSGGDRRGRGETSRRRRDDTSSRRSGWDNDRRDREQDRRYGGRRGHDSRRDDRSRYRDDRFYGDRLEKGSRSGDRSDSNDRRYKTSGNNGKPRRNRGGEDKRSNRRGINRPRFRDERSAVLSREPQIPVDVDWKDLDPTVRQDLRSLSKDNAERVGAHMVAVVHFLSQDDPQRALDHARAAKERGGRVAVVRETLGIAAYHAGEWKEALSELRAARRMSGGPGLVAVMADCERGLGRPEKAIEIAHDDELAGLSPAERADLAIVASGARRDLGDYDAAVLELERFGLEITDSPLVAARVHYAYADALVDAGRGDEARAWFQRCSAEDEDDLLDAQERIGELDSDSAQNTETAASD